MAKIKKIKVKRQAKTNEEPLNEPLKNDDSAQKIDSGTADSNEKKIIDSNNDEIDFNNATLAELAQIAQHYSDRSYETLRRLNRAELINIIKNKSDDRDRTFNGLDRDSDNLLKMIVEILDEIKQARAAQPLNPTLKRIFISQNNKLTEVLINANIKSGLVSISILLIISITLLFDALFGFDVLAKKIKENAAIRKSNINKQQNTSENNASEGSIFA